MNVHKSGKPESVPDLAIAILAGGASRRFGTDKALYRLAPEQPTLIERTALLARRLSDRVIIVGNDRFDDLNLGVSVFEDDEPGRGPLSGIATALRVANAPRVLILACDMPCLSLPLLRMLIERPASKSIVIPLTNDGQYHPMHAIYPRSVLAKVQEALDSGNGSVRSLLDLAGIDPVSEFELRRIDPRLDSLFSLNHPADLHRALRCAR